MNRRALLYLATLMPALAAAQEEHGPEEDLFRIRLDESGIQYQGYSRQECALFDGDSVDHSVTWREKLSLEELKGQVIRLKFYLRDASLYAFSIVPS